MEDIILGAHVSFTKQTQLLGSLEEALRYGANTFMFYTGAPQNTARSSIDLEITALAHRAMEEKGISLSNVVVHAPYIINLASTFDKQEFAIRFLKEEIARTEQLGVSLLVLHPGSHVGSGTEEGIARIVQGLNRVVDSKTNVKICLETMAGKGTECGRSFDEIRKIIDGCHYSEKIMVCLDTCHIHDAGYDLAQFDQVLEQFDQVIGLSKLACIHLNDSKNDLGSHKDRHENIGYGMIGFDQLLSIVYHPKLKGIPKILETPYVTKDDTSKEKLYPPYKFEIEMIRKKSDCSHLLEDIRTYYKKD